MRRHTTTCPNVNPNKHWLGAFFKEDEPCSCDGPDATDEYARLTRGLSEAACNSPPAAIIVYLQNVIVDLENRVACHAAVADGFAAGNQLSNQTVEHLYTDAHKYLPAKLQKEWEAKLGKPLPLKSGVIEIIEVPETAPFLRGAS